MSYFRVKPNILRAECEEMEDAYREMCRDISELNSIAGRLGRMSSFDEPLAVLRRLRNAGNEEMAKLRQCVGALERAADLYSRAEEKNLDGGGLAGWFQTIPLAIQPVRSPEPIWMPGEMLPYARELFAMEIATEQEIEEEEV